MVFSPKSKRLIENNGKRMLKDLLNTDRRLTCVIFVKAKKTGRLIVNNFSVIP